MQETVAAHEARHAHVEGLDAEDFVNLDFTPFDVVLQVRVHPSYNGFDHAKAPAAVRLTLSPAFLRECLGQKLNPGEVYAMVEGHPQPSKNGVTIDGGNLILDANGYVHWVCIAEDGPHSAVLTSVGVNPLDLVDVYDYRELRDEQDAEQHLPESYVSLQSESTILATLWARVFMSTNTMFIGVDDFGRSFMLLHDVLFPKT